MNRIYRWHGYVEDKSVLFVHTMQAGALRQACRTTASTRSSKALRWHFVRNVRELHFLSSWHLDGRPGYGCRYSAEEIGWFDRLVGSDGGAAWVSQVRTTETVEHQDDLFSEIEESSTPARAASTFGGAHPSPPYIDCFRAQHPSEQGAFTCWASRRRRAVNDGKCIHRLNVERNTGSFGYC